MKNQLSLLYKCVLKSCSVLRGAWRTAHVGITSSTGRESVLPQTPGTIHLAASPSVSQQAGRYA